MPRLFIRQFFHADTAVIQPGNVLACGVGACRLQGFLRKIDAQNIGTGLRHRFGQNAAAAADIKHALAC